MISSSFHIIPAQPGYLTVYDDRERKIVEIGEPVIAWRIETTVDDNNKYISHCIPLTVDGEVASNCIGVQNPDSTINIFFESYHKNILELMNARYPK